MLERSKRRVLAYTAGLAAALLPALPALAQEAAAPRTTSYFAQFLHTDNALGTTLIWSCLLFSIVVVSLVIQNAMQSRLSMYIPEELLETLERLMSEKNYREAMDLTASDDSALGQVMHAALSEAPRGYQAMEVAIEDAADTLGNRKVRNLIWLEIAGAVGPMIGLFGTVFGMILAFQKLVASEGTPKASELAGGIATALVCTFWGLVVGIPGVVTASFFRVRFEGLTAEVIIRAKGLIAGLRPGAAKKPAPVAPLSPKPAVSPT